MSAPAPKTPNTSFWLPFALVGVALLLRVAKSTEWGADWLPNFSPWMALAVVGTALFPTRLAWWACPLALITVDFAVQHRVVIDYPLTLVAVYACLVAAAWTGKSLDRRGASGWVLVGGTVAWSLSFYAIMNTVSWAMEPAYAKSLFGWWQSQTTGLPGFPPSWTFLRNALLADTGFAILLVVASHVEMASRRVIAPYWGQRPSTPV